MTPPIPHSVKRAASPFSPRDQPPQQRGKTDNGGSHNNPRFSDEEKDKRQTLYGQLNDKVNSLSLHELESLIALTPTHILSISPKTPLQAEIISYLTPEQIEFAATKSDEDIRRIDAIDVGRLEWVGGLWEEEFQRMKQGGNVGGEKEREDVVEERPVSPPPSTRSESSFHTRPTPSTHNHNLANPPAQPQILTNWAMNHLIPNINSLDHLGYIMDGHFPAFHPRNRWLRENKSEKGRRLALDAGEEKGNGGGKKSGKAAAAKMLLWEKTFGQLRDEEVELLGRAVGICKRKGGRGLGMLQTLISLEDSFLDFMLKEGRDVDIDKLRQAMKLTYSQISFIAKTKSSELGQLVRMYEGMKRDGDELAEKRINVTPEILDLLIQLGKSPQHLSHLETLISWMKARSVGDVDTWLTAMGAAAPPSEETNTAGQKHAGQGAGAAEIRDKDVTSSSRSSALKMDRNKTRRQVSYDDLS